MTLVNKLKRMLGFYQGPGLLTPDKVVSIRHRTRVPRDGRSASRDYLRVNLYLDRGNWFWLCQKARMSHTSPDALVDAMITSMVDSSMADRMKRQEPRAAFPPDPVPAPYNADDEFIIDPRELRPEVA